MRNEDLRVSEEIRSSEDPVFLIEQLRSRFILKDDLQRIDSAIAFADEAHFGQFRAHGGPVIVHPLRVSLDVIANYGINVDRTILALLHDTAEDNPSITLERIAGEFGEEIAGGVDLLSKRVGGVRKNPQVYYGQLRSDSSDPRLVKVYDRIDNLYSWTRQVGEDDRRRLKVQDTLRNIAPLVVDPIAHANLTRAIRAVEGSFSE